MGSTAELKKKANELRKLLRTIEQIPGVGTDENLRDAKRKAAKRELGRIVTIPKCQDRERRQLLESDDAEWLRWYFHKLFWYDFTFQQREMIEAIRNAITNGGDQALAASRGEGKTKLFERMLLKYTLAGTIKLSVLFAATGSAAQDSLQSIMGEIEHNERLYDDYPEVCEPVRALENVSQKAHSQIIQGYRPDNDQWFDPIPSRFSWCGQEIYLPSTPGSPSAGAIIATRGLDAAVRGLNKRNLRVDVAGIDDPDTEETARSEEQAKKLEDRIDRAIAPPRQSAMWQSNTGRLISTTLCQTRFCDAVYSGAGGICRLTPGLNRRSPKLRRSLSPSSTGVVAVWDRC